MESGILDYRVTRSIKGLWTKLLCSWRCGVGIFTPYFSSEEINDRSSRIQLLGYFCLDFLIFWQFFLRFYLDPLGGQFDRLARSLYYQCDSALYCIGIRIAYLWRDIGTF